METGSCSRAPSPTTGRHGDGSTSNAGNREGDIGNLEVGLKLIQHCCCEMRARHTERPWSRQSREDTCLCILERPGKLLTLSSGITPPDHRVEGPSWHLVLVRRPRWTSSLFKCRLPRLLATRCAAEARRTDSRTLLAACPQAHVLHSSDDTLCVPPLQTQLRATFVFATSSASNGLKKDERERQAGTIETPVQCGDQR